MKKNLLSLLLASTLYFLLPANVNAVCPVCTVAVVGGLGLARFFGVDDTISGIWIGGIILSSSFWFVDWAYKKFKKIERINKITFTTVLVIIMYLFVLVPLYLGKIIGHPFNTLWGIDKLVIGITTGTISFLLGMFIDKKIRKINKDRVYFHFQKVIFPVSMLIILSVIMYLVIK